MPSLTDGLIRQAIKRVAKSRQQMSLADGERRGTGRLVLILEPMPTRVTAEWGTAVARRSTCKIQDRLISRAVTRWACAKSQNLIVVKVMTIAAGSLRQARSGLSSAQPI